MCSSGAMNAACAASRVAMKKWSLKPCCIATFPVASKLLCQLEMNIRLCRVPAAPLPRVAKLARDGKGRRKMTSGLVYTTHWNGCQGPLCRQQHICVYVHHAHAQCHVPFQPALELADGAPVWVQREVAEVASVTRDARAPSAATASFRINASSGAVKFRDGPGFDNDEARPLR